MDVIKVVIIGVVVIGVLHFVLGKLTQQHQQQQCLDDSLPKLSHPARDEMLDFVRGHIKDLERNRPCVAPKGSNYFGKFHDSDVHSEITDLSKYFNIEQSVADTRKLLREINGPECGPSGIKDCKEPVPQCVDFQSGNPMKYDVGSDGSPTYLADVWSYRNEKPMNGGKIDGVGSFDSTAGSFALFQEPKECEQANYITSYPFQNTFFQN